MRESDKQSGAKIIFKSVAIAIIFIGCVSIITSCVTVKTFAPALPASTSTPVNIIKTNTPTILPTSTLYVSPTVAATPTQLYKATEKNDYLVYLAVPQIGNKQEAALYTPENNKYTQVLTTTRSSSSFSLSKDNRLAFEKGGNIYIWDYPFAENTQTEIVFNKPPTTEKAILSWSLDGRYLLLAGVQAGNKKLFLWDGKDFLEIYNPQREVSSYHATWSNNGMLAFTEYFVDNTSWEVRFGGFFVWDGKNVVNFSKQPLTLPAWSKDGQLAFLSYQNQKYSILIWDGESINNGVPDIKTLTAPDLELSVNSYPTWTNSGSIVFTGRGKTDSHSQIYEWDGRTIRNISQTPSIEFYFPVWRNDGYWSATVDSGYTIIVRDNANQTVLETRGYNSKWTQSGLLVFCNYKNNHTLSVWNGKNIVDVAHDDYVFAKWTNSNGESILCTYG